MESKKGQALAFFNPVANKQKKGRESVMSALERPAKKSRWDSESGAGGSNFATHGADNSHDSELEGSPDEIAGYSSDGEGLRVCVSLYFALSMSADVSG